jgi:hypothetical protein
MDNIHFTQSVKYLGIMVDSKLQWETQIDHLLSRLSSLTFMIKNVKGKIPTPSLLYLYYSHVESLLRYGVIFWGNTQNAVRVFRAQKRVIRIIASLPFSSHCKPSFQRLEVLTLPSLFILESLLFIKKYPNYYPTGNEVCYELRNKPNYPYILSIEQRS